MKIQKDPCCIFREKFVQFKSEKKFGSNAFNEVVLLPTCFYHNTSFNTHTHDHKETINQQHSINTLEKL